MQSSPESTPAVFYDKTGYRFSAVSKQQLLDAREALRREYGLTSIQSAEAASYSLAMVVRFALGLSATGGKVCLLVNDSLAGEVALACARHLFNAGSEPLVIPFCVVSNASEGLRHQLSILSKMQVKVETMESLPQLGASVDQAHNLIFALFGGKVTSTFAMDDLVKLLNEARTPIHCVEAPYGVNVDTGQLDDEPLYASSTLSLGAPFKGLYTADDYVGRHYVCDISLTKTLYKAMGDDLTPLFSDQPVVQIFPGKREEEE